MLRQEYGVGGWSCFLIQSYVSPGVRSESVCMSASPFTDEKTSPGWLVMIKLQCTSQFTVFSYHDSTI